jgi:beta-galactosidase
MRIGTAWYPEYHSSEQWDRDLAQIREAGITSVRFGEFAWSQIEPEEGRFDSDWMERAIAAMAKHGIGAVIGTPTATPPIWLGERHPEILPVNDLGRRTLHGMRQHRCYTAPAYRLACERVTDHLARRFGRLPGVTAWQIDNEMGGEAKACYCDLCRARFQGWLSARYDGIADLNRRWGTRFWSQAYQDFAQIPAPRQGALQLGLKHNPSLMLEWLRFSSEVMVEFCRDQAAVVRRHIAPATPVTTNYDAFDWGENIDLRRMFAYLDVVGFDLYSDKDHEIAFYCDFMHDVLGKPFWFMEYHIASSKLDAELDAIAGSGAVDALYFFKFRPFPWGQEQGTTALRTVTGQPTANYRALVERAKRPARPRAAMPERRIGVVYDHDSSWARFLTGWSGVPQDLTYPREMIQVVYRALHDQGRRARFILRPRDLRDLDLLVMPWTVIHDPELERAVLRHVRGGGSLLLTQDVFLKNRDNVFNETLPALYREILGVPDFLDQAPAGARALVHEATVGGARAVVLAPAATVEDWAHWIARLAPSR